MDVALDVFARRGFHATSMNQVAYAAGVTKPVLYQHFASKRELYAQLLADVGHRLEEQIAKATAQAGGPREQVELGFGAYFAFVESERESFQLLFGSGTRHDDEFAETARRVEAAIAALLAELIDVPGLAQSERRLLAHGVVGIAEATSRHWVAGDLADDLDVATLARRMAELAWAGLRGVQAG
jgi:AcrR family transcriptional regulator